MKLNFWVRLWRNRKIRKFLTVLAAILLGFCLAAEGRFVFMRINDISVSPPGALPQYAVWGTLTPAQEAFWPSFWYSEKQYASLIEQYYPVKVAVRITGWGRFNITVEPLIPLFKVYWAGKFWYLADDGRLWSSSLKGNTQLGANKAESLPVLSWGADRTTPINISEASGNVYASSLPVNKIKSWYNSVEKLAWAKNVKFVQAGESEGSPVVRLIFYAGNGANGAQLLLPEEAGKWLKTGAALKKLYGGIYNLPADLYIDGTYRDKILIRNLKQPENPLSEDKAVKPKKLKQ